MAIFAERISQNIYHTATNLSWVVFIVDVNDLVVILMTFRKSVRNPKLLDNSKNRDDREFSKNY